MVHFNLKWTMIRIMDKKKILVTRSSMPPYEEYIKAIESLWDTHWLTNMGEYHRKLEKELKDYLQVEKLSLMVNGHMALELTIQAFGFPEGAEVITTPYTFISTTHAIVRNHLQPVFCDVKIEDGTIDESKIERLITDKTVAIIPIHVYGNICNVKEIQKIADKHGLKVIYDAAHAFGEKYKGVGVGNFGDASIFSFHATKVFNTIEGGAVALSDKNLEQKLYNLKNFGIRNEEYIESVGANAKMNEFCAVMGICNLKYVSENIEKREKLVRKYEELLSKSEKIKLNNFNEDVSLNYAYMPIWFLNKQMRDDIYIVLRQQDIYARKYFYPLTVDAECFGETYKYSDINIARDLANRVLVLPLYPELSVEEVERIAKLILANI